FYVQNDSVVLKKNYCDFEPEWLYSGICEFSLKSPVLKTNFYAALLETPYDNLSFWFKAEGRTAWKNFLLDFSYFAVPSAAKSPNAAPLIGGSSSICRTLEQFSLNPQILFLFDDKNSSSLRLGVNVLNMWKITDTNKVEELQLMKIRSGICFENSFFTGQLDFTTNNLLLDGVPPTVSSTPEKYYGCRLSLSSAFSSCGIYFSADYKNYPPPASSSARKDSVDFSIKATPGRAKILNASAGLSLIYKDMKRYSGNFSAGAGLKLKSKKIRSSIKIQLEIPFQ
ncbi:MAG: hypothetical protein KBT11_07620, partial [Treponema sp.]|nr:hypothetical protein [Candidatus Treponema equifaecale]